MTSMPASMIAAILGAATMLTDDPWCSVFHATEVLAKHDENYMPPEAADAIGKAHKDKGMSLSTLSTAK